MDCTIGQLRLLESAASRRQALEWLGQLRLMTAANAVCWAKNGQSVYDEVMGELRAQINATRHEKS